MKKSILILLILYFCFIFDFNNKVYAGDEGKSDKKSFSIDSLMKNTEVDLRLHYGFFVHHHNDMTGYQARFPMFELSLQKQTFGNSSWQSYLNYPTIGVTAYYSNLGNIDIIGNAYAIYPFINFPFNKSKINTLGLKFGIGLGYITKKYHPIDNFHNTSIGVNFNAAINLTFEYKRQMTDKYKMAIFAGLTHFSNGCSNYPNSGINIITSGLGLSYMFGKPNDYIPKPKISIDYKGFKPEYYVGFSFGIKRIMYKQKDNISVYNLEFYVMDRVSNTSKIGIGLDLVYNTCNCISAGNYYGLNKKYDISDLLKPGIGFAYELLMGDISFLINIGFHTYRYDTSKNFCYQKLSTKIDLGEYLYGKITLNTHFGVADFIGFGLGAKL